MVTYPTNDMPPEARVGSYTLLIFRHFVVRCLLGIVRRLHLRWLVRRLWLNPNQLTDMSVLAERRLAVVDWSGDGASREHSAAGVARQQLQELWSHARDYHRQVTGGCAVRPRLWRNWRLLLFSVVHVLYSTFFTCCH